MQQKNPAHLAQVCFSLANSDLSHDLDEEREPQSASRPVWSSSNSCAYRQVQHVRAGRGPASADPRSSACSVPGSAIRCTPRVRGPGRRSPCTRRIPRPGSLCAPIRVFRGPARSHRGYPRRVPRPVSAIVYSAHSAARLGAPCTPRVPRPGLGDRGSPRVPRPGPAIPVYSAVLRPPARRFRARSARSRARARRPPCSSRAFGLRAAPCNPRVPRPGPCYFVYSACRGPAPRRTPARSAARPGDSVYPRVPLWGRLPCSSACSAARARCSPRIRVFRGPARRPALCRVFRGPAR